MIKRKKCKYFDEVEGKRCKRDDPHEYARDCRINVSFDIVVRVEGMADEKFEFDSRKERRAFKEGFLTAMRRTRNNFAYSTTLVKPW